MDLQRALIRSLCLDQGAAVLLEEAEAGQRATNLIVVLGRFGDAQGLLVAPQGLLALAGHVEGDAQLDQEAGLIFGRSDRRRPARDPPAARHRAAGRAVHVPEGDLGGGNLEPQPTIARALGLAPGLSQLRARRTCLSALIAARRLEPASGAPPALGSGLAGRGAGPRDPGGPREDSVALSVSSRASSARARSSDCKLSCEKAASRLSRSRAGLSRAARRR